MTPLLALDVIENLARGIDPVSGTAIRNESVLSHPMVIRALFMAKDALQQSVETGIPKPFSPQAGAANEVATAHKALQARKLHWTDKLSAQRNQVVSATITSPPNSKVGKKWEAADRDRLLALHQAGTPIQEISAQLERAAGGIVAKLVHEGVFQDREAAWAEYQRQNELPVVQPAKKSV